MKKEGEEKKMKKKRWIQKEEPIQAFFFWDYSAVKQSNLQSNQTNHLLLIIVQLEFYKRSKTDQLLMTKSNSI